MDAGTRAQWLGLVEFLGAVLGDTAEILLEIPGEGIVAVGNEGLFGHHVGDPVTPKTEELLSSAEQAPYRICHVHHPASGRPLRRCHFFLQDQQGGIQGVLTVTQDLSEFHAVIDSLTRLVGKLEPRMPEPGVPMEDKKGAVSSALMEMGLSHVEPHRLTEAEVEKLIELLTCHGVFETRGAVAEIAGQLGISPSTVYRHISGVTRKGWSGEQGEQTVSGAPGFGDRRGPRPRPEQGIPGPHGKGSPSKHS